LFVRVDSFIQQSAVLPARERSVEMNAATSRQ
jgi:hypothetical protein